MRILYLAMALSALIGCAPSSTIQKAQDLPPPSPSIMPQIVSRDTLTNRIISLNSLLGNNNISIDNKGIILSVKQTYEMMRNAMDDSGTDQPPPEAIRDFISGLEKANDSLLSSKTLLQHEREELIRKLNKSIKDIVAIYRKGDTKAVIAACDAFQTEYGPDAFTIELTAALASSLAKEGRIQEAISLAEAAAPAIREGSESCDLPEKLSHWKAEFHKKQEIQVDNKEKGRLAEILAQADSLAKSGEFDRAKELLTAGRAEFNDEPSFFQIDKALEKVEGQREGLVEERIAVISKRGEIVAEAKDLISREMPEEALARLKPLDFGDAEPDSEVKALRAEAIEQIISRERNRAARLFLQARNTKDTTSKDQLLRSSYEALKALVERYPDSPSFKKIMENMQTVEKELSALKRPQTTKP